MGNTGELRRPYMLAEISNTFFVEAGAKRKKKPLGAAFRQMS